MACPNINSPQWKDLVSKIGVFEAMREFIKNGEEIPDAANYQETFSGINATLTVVGALQKMTRNSYPSNQVQGFYNDLIKLGTPKNQLDLLKDHIERNNIKQINVNDLIVSILSEMNYTIEINTAKETQILPTRKLTEEEELAAQYVDPYMMGVPSKEQQVPTQHHANLTVPGGTNYTENEIATPAIVPSIKGHAAFSTDNGIGWFRSDNRMLDRDERTVPYSWTSINNPNEVIEEGTPTKTRRILEVQSDLFQKGRNIKSPDEVIQELQKSGKLEIKCD